MCSGSDAKSGQFWYSDLKRPIVKICGLRKAEHAMLAESCGADLLGFIFVERSRSYITPDAAGRITAKVKAPTVGVFENQSLDYIQLVIKEAQIDIVQLHGDEPSEWSEKHIGRPVIKRFRPAEIHTIDISQGYLPLIDPGGGDGKIFDWNSIKDSNKPYLLAGGINIENIANAEETLKPLGYDISSGVEGEQRGFKSEAKIEALFDKLRAISV